MSWKASAWAKEQRLGSPAGKSILMCLADYADPEGMIKGWASQADLADAAEVSERTAREWLQRLEDWGLVERQRQQRPSGARAADWIVLKLDVRIHDGGDRCRAATGDCENLPAESAGRTNRQPDAEPTGNQTHPTGSQFRAYKDKPPIEPPLPSHQTRAEAREREELEDDKKIEKRGWALFARWPGFAGMPKKAAMRTWKALSPEDRDLAEQRFDGWLALLKAQKKDYVPAPSTYFGERLFADVPDPKPEPFNEYAPPFGPVWGGWIWAHLLTAEGQAEKGWPLVAALFQRAALRQGHRFAEHLHGRAALMEAVPVGSDVFEAWRAEHERRGWPWIPDPGDQRVVYFPAGGPEGLQAFAAALRQHNEEQGNDGGGREAAE